jgi:UDP-N-acetylmuramate dehydrogenase
MTLNPRHNSALFNLLTCLGMEENVPLASFSTLKVGGPARFFVSPKTPEDIATIERASSEHGLDLHIISGGSNTLFSDHGFDGIIMKLGPQFDFIDESPDGLSMRVGAATSYAKVTKMALARGWTTAVGWTGIPGLIGGAVRMNAGTRAGEIKDAIRTVHGIINGKRVVFENTQIEFGYRKSNLPSGLIIHQADLFYDHHLIQPPAQLNLKVQEYRLKRKLTQPTINSLGSFFKNPYPSFAAQLIEKCNLKGLQYKGAQISPLHANFIVNNGGASAFDILYIASIAQKTVFNHHGIMLYPEIKLVGSFPSDHGLCTEPETNNPNVS